MNEKYRITKNSISFIGGICSILFPLVVLFSNGTPFSFLMTAITHSFGFVGFWVIMPYFVIIGFYLIFRKRLIKLKMGVTMWGLVIIILCLLILCSHWSSIGTTINGLEIVGKGTTEEGTAKYLTFSNSMEVFDIVAKETNASFGPSIKLGGGKVGFLFAGALNSAISPVGLNIVCWLFFLGGMVMVFNAQVFHIGKLFKKKRDGDDDVFKEVKIETMEAQPQAAVEETPAPVVEEKEETPVYDNRPIFESFHTSAPINNEYDLKKAHFVLKGEENTSEETNENSFTKPDFEEEIIEEKEPINNTESIISEENTSEEVYHEPEMERVEVQPEISEPIKEDEPPVIEKDPLESIPYENRPQPKANILKNYIYPSIDLLDLNESNVDQASIDESCKQRVETINTTFRNLGIGAEVVSYVVGPSVTRFDVETNANSTVTVIQKYITDISLRLNGAAVRFVPIVTGKSTSGLEVTNEIRTNVYLREVVEELPKGEENRLEIPFGKDISGDLQHAKLVDFPHMLIAGTTGSGKSIFVHSVIITLLMRNRPDELKFIMVDPKKVEMNYYDDIPHLLCPVISDMKKVLVAFNKLVSEMERRYNLFKDNKVRDIVGFNKFAKTAGLQPLPYIVVVIDEYADLVENVKEIKEPVVRLAQKARAAGIHIIFATQRPSVNVVDGTIKANVSTRVALSCASAIDSQTVIGTGGAEKLLGHGDMLIDCPLISRTMKPRAQGCYVSEVEIMRVCDFLREHYQPQFDPMFVNLEPVVEEKHYDEPKVDPIDKSKTEEEVYQRIKDDTRYREFFSISYITRTYGMGFSRAGKMFHRLVEEGVVEPTGDARGSKVIGYVPGAQPQGSIEQSTLVPDENDEFDN